LWESDGTNEGTGSVADIRRGTQPSRVSQIEVSGGSAYVTADNGVTGREPYVIPRAGASAAKIGTGCGPTSPGLEATAPIVGGRTTLRGVRAPVSHVALVILSGELNAPGLPLPGGCVTRIDLGSLLILGTFPTFTNEWTLDIAIPNDPVLSTGKVVAWVVYVPLRGGDLTATNAVLLAPGN
jgi:hypothetical protein